MRNIEEIDNNSEKPKEKSLTPRGAASNYLKNLRLRQTSNTPFGRESAENDIVIYSVMVIN